MNLTYDWPFPLPRPHTGPLQGNAVLGVMIWGHDNQLNLTIGRADFWDRRGGKRWTEQMNYFHIRKLLESNDEKSLREIFKEESPGPGQPRRPSILPIGRFELLFPDNYTITKGTLHLATASVTVRLADEKDNPCEFTLDLATDKPVLNAHFPPNAPLPKITRVPSWQHVHDYLELISFKPPEMIDREDLIGWSQSRPNETSLYIGYRLHERDLWLACDYSDDQTTTHIARAITDGRPRFLESNEKWWTDYWNDVPTINTPNDRFQFLYYYGMYKFATISNPNGIPSGLQGPFIEDYQLPPWGADYHFNINVQECYWPAYQGNRLSHLLPLFEMIWSWRDTLRQNAKNFVGIDDGYSLPHSVTDTCGIIGAFWTGTIDHACTAWVGKMMYDYYLYTGDQNFLRTRAYPFLQGAMRVYEKMLEKNGDAASYFLPVSVSPEYRGAAFNAWGRNASFQLGCIQWLIEALLHSCHVLNETPNPAWLDIQKNLPKACVEKDSRGHEKIFMWQGTDLEESHRHHSHWAPLHPWDVIDLADPHWKQIVKNTYDWWLEKGMGLWSGWCIPWAAMLHARIGSPHSSEALIEYWQRLYTNEGHGTTHDPIIEKRNVLEQREISPILSMTIGGKRGEIMQMDAGMAATAAILDLLIHVRRGVHYLFQGCPNTWRNVSFTKIRTEGGFLVSASRTNNQVTQIEITATYNNTFRLSNPWSDHEPLIERTMSKGQTIQLAPS